MCWLPVLLISDCPGTHPTQVLMKTAPYWTSKYWLRSLLYFFRVCKTSGCRKRVGPMSQYHEIPPSGISVPRSSVDSKPYDSWFRFCCYDKNAKTTLVLAQDQWLGVLDLFFLLGSKSIQEILLPVCRGQILMCLFALSLFNPVRGWDLLTWFIAWAPTCECPGPI